MTSEVIVPQPRTTINSPQDLISEGIRPRPRRIIISRLEASFLRDLLTTAQLLVWSSAKPLRCVRLTCFHSIDAHQRSPVLFHFTSDHGGIDKCNISGEMTNHYTKSCRYTWRLDEGKKKSTIVHVKKLLLSNIHPHVRRYAFRSSHWFLYSDLRLWNLNTMIFDQANDFIKSIVLVTKTWDATRKRANVIVNLRYFSRPGIIFKGGHDSFFRYLGCRQLVHNYCKIHDVCHDTGNVSRAVYTVSGWKSTS